MPTAPVTVEAGSPADHHRRWLLWVAMLLLLCALVGTAMVLAHRFQENRVLAQLDQETATLVSDIRAGLSRNIQTLQVLRDRIARRLETMFATGAVEEVRALLALGLDPALPAMKAIGVPEIAAMLRGEIDQATAVARAITATHQYAKRQRTWFRGRMADWIWRDPSAPAP